MAKVFANLTTPILVLHDGAVFEGYRKEESCERERKATPLTLKQKGSFRESPQAQ